MLLEFVADSPLGVADLNGTAPASRSGLDRENKRSELNGVRFIARLPRGKLHKLPVGPLPQQIRIGQSSFRSWEALPCFLTYF
jgi:hypothetical protein